jgi:nicotinamide mononucleotide transporter
MTEFLEPFSNTLSTQFHQLIGWELAAVILALAYLFLAMRRSLWCWPAAFVSTLIYTVLFWQVALLMESLLNFYYMGMAIFGYWQWQKGSKNNGDIMIVSWSKQRHLIAIATLIIVSLISGWIMDRFTSADFAYLDAATTCFAVFTTYLVAIKVLENWLYWIAIDAVSIYLYLSKDLYLTAALFVAYVILAMVGYVSWKRVAASSGETLRAQPCER